MLPLAVAGGDREYLFGGVVLDLGLPATVW